jgi:hypothetical protein
MKAQGQFFETILPAGQSFNTLFQWTESAKALIR